MAEPLSIHNSGTIDSLFSVQIGVLLRPYRNASPMPSRLGGDVASDRSRCHCEVL